MNVDQNNINVRLDRSAYLNLIAFIVFSIVEIFNFLPIVLLIGVDIISVYNITIVSIILNNCNKNKDVLQNYKKSRNSSYRIIGLAVGLAIIASIKIIIANH